MGQGCGSVVPLPASQEKGPEFDPPVKKKKDLQATFWDNSF